MTYSVSTEDFSDLDQCNSSSNTLSDDTLHQNPPNVEVSHSQSSSSNQPNIKVIPISFNHPNQPTVESTTSSIEDILADKVERIAAHLEKANSNILHVDNRIRSFRTEHTKNFQTANQQESIQTLTELRDQIDARLKEQAQVNQNLNKSIKSLKNVSEKASTFPANKNNVNPLYNSNHTYPSKSIQFSEDTQTFLDRIRRDADQRVNDALRTVENSEPTSSNSNNEKILQKLESILQQQEIERNQKNLDSRLAENKQYFESESQKLKRTAKMFEDEKKKLQVELKSAHLEITGLKQELGQLKHEVSLNNLHKMKKSDQDQRDNDSQIHALKATLQSLISGRAELENELENYKTKIEQSKAESENKLAQVRIKYENEISEYQREYDRQLRNLQNEQHTKSHTINKESHSLRKENDQLRKKVSFLSHEIEQRDIQIADVRSSFNLFQNRTQLSGSQEDRGFLVSVASILNDLTGKKGEFIDTKCSTEKLKRDIVHELASCVERTSLAEKMQLKAEQDRKEMKERVKVLLDRIDREKQLQMEAHSMQNERAFQDTIQVLQNELERTRKQIKIQNKNYSR